MKTSNIKLMLQIFIFSGSLVFLPAITLCLAENQHVEVTGLEPSIDSAADIENVISKTEQLIQGSLDLDSIPIEAAIISDSTEGFIDPVTVKVMQMKEQGKSDNEIVDSLRSQGFGYFPESGATWINEPLNLAKGEEFPERGNPHNEINSIKAKLNNRLISSKSHTGGNNSHQRNQVMQTVDTQNSGFFVRMRPGHMEIATNKTRTNYVTTHLTKKFNGSSNWTEAGVASWVTKGGSLVNRKFFTYDNDEGKWGFPGGSTSPTFISTYKILVTDTYESPWGYKYNTYINGNWVRSGHVLARYNRIDHANEIFTKGNPDLASSWSNNSITAYFLTGVLYRASGATVSWNQNINTKWWGHPYPTKQAHWLSSGSSSWNYMTWTAP